MTSFNDSPSDVAEYCVINAVTHSQLEYFPDNYAWTNQMRCKSIYLKYATCVRSQPGEPGYLISATHFHLMKVAIHGRPKWCMCVVWVLLLLTEARYQ